MPSIQNSEIVSYRCVFFFYTSLKLSSQRFFSPNLLILKCFSSQRGRWWWSWWCSSETRRCGGGVGHQEEGGDHGGGDHDDGDHDDDQG